MEVIQEIRFVDDPNHYGRFPKFIAHVQVSTQVTSFSRKTCN